MTVRGTMQSSRTLRALLAGAALALAGAANAGVEGLVSNSPFLPESATAPAAASGALDRYELRGVASFGGVLTFSIYDATGNRGLWIPLEGTEAGIRVVSYDAQRESVVIEGEGVSRRVALKEAQIQPLIAPPVAAPAGAVVQGSPLPQAQGAVTSEQDMAERRQRIIEELRRRRALRQNQQTPSTQ